ncbi:MAG: DEAD/DEAH box helicase [Anaerolineae bacterium]|nr:DEAD/DEAH box helicase [Anaerolineae bacterium]MDW8098630.1 DEAD/DEAH box helicase [Anaerolineae bacterium]
MPLYPYQERVKALLHQGRSVVLQAPTGSGKTRAALAPFVEAFFDLPNDAFPKQCLYSVPMRVLASQFYHEYHGLARRYERVHRRKLDVRIQTGERPEDPELVGDLVFATLDQTLSSALGVPYSLSSSRANLNIGAVLSSYLVFDEFHLFPYEAMQSTLQLLRLVSRLVPFLLMTATFSRTMLEAIGELLEADLVVVSPEEVAHIETQWGQRPRKWRRFEVAGAELTAEAVLAAHDLRSLVVCNTVDRAIALYEQLRRVGCRPVPVTDPDLAPIYQVLAGRLGDEWDKAAAQGVRMLRDRLAAGPEDRPWVMLLHSRFERPHRQLKEALLQALWNPRGLEVSDGPSLIVVATQVVEVGLDISAQTLHTEIAPAASVLQRAGRCARYPGQQGQVIIYPVPLKEDGEPDYAPYGGSRVEVVVCDRSWQAFRERDGAILDFAAEQEVINQAHSEADAAMLQAMREGQGELWQRITDALVSGDPSARPQLIRRVDSRTVIVYEAPSSVSEESPYHFQGISIWHGTLRGKVNELNQMRDDLGLDWALRYLVVQGDEEKDEELVYRWLDVERPDDISLSLIFAVHPRLAAYDAEHGLWLGRVSDGSYLSPRVTMRRERPDYASYQLESYLAHIANMRRIFEGDIAAHNPVADGRLRRRLAWPARRFAEQEGDWRLPAGLLERAVRLAIALHDVGKLSEEWQRFAAKYQEAIGECAPAFLVAHTHYERGNPVHEEAQRKTRRYKPSTHAGESASAAVRLLFEALDGRTYPGLYRAAFTAIARHHSPSLDEAKPYRLHPKASETVAEALAVVGGIAWREWARWLRSAEEAPNVRKHLPEAPPDGDWAWWFQYFIIVRILRLCDGLSQEEG